MTGTSYSDYQADTTNEIIRQDDFTVTYLNPCIDTAFTTITPATQTQPASDNYSDTQITYTYSAYTVVPDICPLTVTCIDVTNPTCSTCSFALTSLSCPSNPFGGSLSFNFDKDDYTGGLAPGDYVF